MSREPVYALPTAVAQAIYHDVAALFAPTRKAVTEDPIQRIRRRVQEWLDEEAKKATE